MMFCPARGRSIHTDHDARRLDDGVCRLAFFELQFIRGFIGDRSREGLPADVDAYMGGGRAFLDVDNFAFELMRALSFMSSLYC